MTDRAAIYARSSPDFPLTAEQQINLLSTVAAEHGWTVMQVFTDRPTTVRKGVDRRSGEMALLDTIRKGAINKVLMLSICRIGKSLVDLAKFLETCRSADVSLYVHEPTLDTTISDGLSICDLGTMMALHVRQSRRGQILWGLAASRAMSIRPGRPHLSRAKTQRAEQELAAGESLRTVPRLAGMSAASVSRINTSMNSEVATR